MGRFWAGKNAWCFYKDLYFVIVGSLLVNIFFYGGQNVTIYLLESVFAKVLKIVKLVGSFGLEAIEKFWEY